MNDEALLRYSRQIMLPEIDIAGQERLLAAKVLIIGLGGLGCPVALYLAATGVGELILVDDDEVDLSNLQRQIAHDESTIGQAKVTSAQASIGRLSSRTKVTPIDRRLAGDELTDMVRAADVVVDATDNFGSRYEVNAASVETGTPLVSGAAIRMEGQVAVFDPRDPQAPCYRCLYAEGSDAELNCAENGVVAPLVGIIGTIQAMETVKLIAQVGETLTGYVLYLDAKRMELRRLKLPKNPNCPGCGVPK